MPTKEFIEKATADSNGDPFLFLLTVDHEDLAEPMRFVRNTVDIVSRSETYAAFPFDVVLPGDGENGVRPARISIDNVDQRIVQTIRAIATAPTMTIELVKGSDPDTVEEALPPMKVFVAPWDRNTLECELTDSADDESEPLMQFEFTPSQFPALFN